MTLLVRRNSSGTLSIGVFFFISGMFVTRTLHRFRAPLAFTIMRIARTVQQFFPGLTSYPSNVICLPAAGLAGYLSWTFIEHPILRRAPRFAEGAEIRVGRLFTRFSLPLASATRPGQEP